MTKTEFFNLVDKYNLGSCTLEEKNAIAAFCEKVQIGEISVQWSLSEEETVRIRILKRILRSVDEFENLQKQQKRRSLSILWRVAASVALIAGLTWVYLAAFQSSNPDVQFITMTTQRGQRETVTLTDGSVVHLNAESSISFPETFVSGSNREVELSGEAFFEVARNPEKPFVVKTGNLNTTVLGTSFNIQAYPDADNIQVTVATGKVQVAASPQGTVVSPAQALLLTRGQQMIYNRLTEAMDHAEVSLDKYLAWKNDIILLDRVTMEEAAEILGRWYNVQFVFENEKVKDCVINGEFRNDQLSNIMENLRFLTNIGYEILPGNRVIIRGQSCH